MCGRYTLFRDPRALLKRLRTRNAAIATFAPNYNISPTTPSLAIVNLPEREARELQFGLVPDFTRRTTARLSTFNARIETLATSPLYGRLLPSRRCIVLADGYYEWPANPVGAATPVYIFRKDGATIAFAGLWQGSGMTVVTREPNAFTAQFHDRMPVALEPDAADAWLRSDTLAPETALALLTPSDSEIWDRYYVDRAVGNAKSVGPQLIEPRPRPEPSPQLPLF